MDEEISLTRTLKLGAILTGRRRRRTPFGAIFATAAMAALLLAVLVPAASASELVSLKNGFDVVCDHRESAGTRVRLYLSPGSSNFEEIGADEITAIGPGPAAEVSSAPTVPGTVRPPHAVETKPSLSASELREMVARAGAQHHIEADLLASIVHAESGGRVRAVSRTGALGLMQLMPATATQVGVRDSFRPEENIGGGAAYLDSLLARYGDNLALALAAYNAGPGAVARWHGIPPYRETRAYVARVIREFNARRPSPAAKRKDAGSMAAVIMPAAIMPAVIMPVVAGR